jgi:DNA-directed RNA polymerase specialized sigma24 family protein
MTGGTVDDRFAQAFRRNYARVAGLAWQVLRDRAAAEDVAQESFLRLADAAVLERPDREVDAWLTRVALNRAINTLRGRRAGSSVDHGQGADVHALGDAVLAAGDVGAEGDQALKGRVGQPDLVVATRAGQLAVLAMLRATVRATAPGNASFAIQGLSRTRPGRSSE